MTMVMDFAASVGRASSEEDSVFFEQDLRPFMRADLGEAQEPGRDTFGQPDSVLGPEKGKALTVHLAGRHHQDQRRSMPAADLAGGDRVGRKMDMMAPAPDQALDLDRSEKGPGGAVEKGLGRLPGNQAQVHGHRVPLTSPDPEAIFAELKPPLFVFRDDPLENGPRQDQSLFRASPGGEPFRGVLHPRPSLASRRRGHGGPLSAGGGEQRIHLDPSLLVELQAETGGFVPKHPAEEPAQGDKRFVHLS